MADAQPVYVVWSNEHRCWWGPDHCGYRANLADAGRYTRDEALSICRNARGGREFRDNPSEVPLLLADAMYFWGDDRPEWRAKRRERKEQRRRDMEREYGYSTTEDDDNG